MSPSWTELTDAEAEEMRPFMLDGADMSAEDVEKVRSAYYAALLPAMEAVCNVLGRFPTEEEARAVFASVVKHINRNVSAKIRQEAAGLH